MPNLIAYHNDAAIKTAIMAQLARHREADELVKGQYWEDGKGCAIGCTLYSSNHLEYQVRFGIPVILARLEDRIFEGLPNGHSKAWPERFMGAIRPGSDLAMVWPRFALWLLTEELPQRTVKYPRCTAALADVATLYREFVETGKSPTIERWIAARKTAYAAAAAAYAAAAADAAYAAAAAADAADDDAAYAAAAAAAYAAAARDQCYIRMADKLIELLEAST
jgi:hypothetical protein